MVEEARHAAGNDEDLREVGGIAGHEHRKRNEQQADDGDGARQAVDAVDHVEGVDGAHGGDEGERDADDAEGDDFGGRREVPQVLQRDARAIHHGEADRGLDDQADLETDVEDVVGKTGGPHDDDTADKGIDPGIGKVEEVIDQGHAAEVGNEHPDATHEGRDRVVGLVTTRLVDHIEAMRSDDGIADSHRRYDKPQQEQCEREHLTFTPHLGTPAPGHRARLGEFCVTRARPFRCHTIDK